MQTTRKGVSTPVFFIEFATRVQTGKYQFNHADVFGRVQTDRNAAAIVSNAHRAIAVYGDGDGIGMATQGLIGGIVYDFLTDVGRVVGTGIHTGTLFNRFQAF